MGLASHIQADHVFHALVCHLSGSLFEADLQNRSFAVERHFGLESLMDLHFIGGISNLKHYSLRRTIKKAETPLPALLARILSAAGDELNGYALAQACQKGFAIFSAMQALYRNRVACRFVTRLYPLLPRSGKEIATLFYLVSREADLNSIAGNISYTDRGSGNENIVTLSALFDRTVDLSSALCKKIDDSLAGSMAFDAGDCGPVMEY